MALMNVGDVTASTAALLDDPSQSAIDKDYVIPFINLRWSNLAVNMAMLGLQYTEEVAEFVIPAGTLTLSNFMIPDQPLAAMLQPVSIDWKLPGQDDTQYDDAEQVLEVNDFPQGTSGIKQFSWQGGTCQMNPSAQDVMARVRYKALGTTLFDPEDNMVRGVGDVLAYRVAEIIYSVRGNDKMALKCQVWGDAALDDFLAMSVMKTQANPISVPPAHGRLRSASAPFTTR